MKYRCKCHCHSSGLPHDLANGIGCLTFLAMIVLAIVGTMLMGGYGFALGIVLGLLFGFWFNVWLRERLARQARKERNWLSI